MPAEYEPLTVETTNEHLRRVYRLNHESSTIDRRYEFRIPILLVSQDGLLLLRDMTSVDAPSKNACIAPPIAQFETVKRHDMYRKLVSKYVQKELLPSHRFERLPGTIEPLGVYKTYPADSGEMARDITSMPAFISMDLSSSDLRISGRYQYFRGRALWLEPGQAVQDLEDQFSTIPDNNLALESLMLVAKLVEQMGDPAYAAHTRTV